MRKVEPQAEKPVQGPQLGGAAADMGLSASKACVGLALQLTSGGR